MGSGFSCLFPCFKPANQNHQADLIFTESEPLDETLGHSFCYVRSSARFLSPSHSDRLSPSHSLRLSPSHEPALKTRPGFAETAFKSISGASVSANTYTPRTVPQHDHIYDDATECVGNTKSSIVNGFESSSSFSALPLQPIPRGGDASGPIDRGFFMSGPIERGALSGPLDGGPGSDARGVPFSAPLGGLYLKKKRKKGFSGFGKSFYRNFSEKKRQWVVPVLNFVARKEASAPDYGADSEARNEDNVHWAHGTAGEDRVHVVVSEELGWLFVGIYDGFNGPDAPEFLMGNLYRAVFKELEGLFWDAQEASSLVVRPEGANSSIEDVVGVEGNDPSSENCARNDDQEVLECGKDLSSGSVKRVTFQSEQMGLRRKPLWEFLAEDEAEDGLDLSGSDRFAFSVDDAVRVSSASSTVRRRSLLLSKLKHGFSKHKEGQSRKLFPWRYDWEDKEKTEPESKVEERACRSFRKRKVGPIDHESVLRALSRALEVTELAYLEMTDKVLDRNPELALMGSCLLVVLMRDEDVYVMNLGDSRAIVAQYTPQTINSSMDPKIQGNNGWDMESIVEESTTVGERAKRVVDEATAPAMRLNALQLSTDHSTSIEEGSSCVIRLVLVRELLRHKEKDVESSFVSSVCNLSAVIDQLFVSGVLVETCFGNLKILPPSENKKLRGDVKVMKASERRYGVLDMDSKGSLVKGGPSESGLQWGYQLRLRLAFSDLPWLLHQIRHRLKVGGILSIPRIVTVQDKTFLYLVNVISVDEEALKPWSKGGFWYFADRPKVENDAMEGLELGDVGVVAIPPKRPARPDLGSKVVPFADQIENRDYTVSNERCKVSMLERNLGVSDTLSLGALGIDALPVVPSINGKPLERPWEVVEELTGAAVSFLEVHSAVEVLWVPSCSGSPCFVKADLGTRVEKQTLSTSERNEAPPQDLPHCMGKDFTSPGTCRFLPTQEVLRIKEEHPEDSQCIVNDRVKGRLMVTRAFGAGFLKQPKWNNALLEMFRNEYIGTAPYLSCSPSLCHHKLGHNDHFLVLSSDGLYQYLSNQEVVSHVESFMEKFPDGDPAQHLIEELLFRAAKKAGLCLAFLGWEPLTLTTAGSRGNHRGLTYCGCRLNFATQLCWPMFLSSDAIHLLTATAQPARCTHLHNHAVVQSIQVRKQPSIYDRPLLLMDIKEP
ncbi:hypothetical protein HHK36_028540 [Tetracentron sinense]|uniref:PPM-type phosphatase domain-containing protein n=1 Tax=Tetracentron sinense TaxID=13715 RepID=A0A834YFK2_TETSI|nr:hypothetical protein HHK36_028540 [Tetracentron sinense]